MLAFDADGIIDFFMKLGKTFLYVLSGVFGVYIVSTFSMWILFPFIPKYEDFQNEEDRKKYFDSWSMDLLMFIFVVIAVTPVFSGYVR